MNQYIQNHLIRVAKMLRPQNELERMTAIAEHACFGFSTKYAVDMHFSDANETVYEKYTPAYDLTPLEYAFVRKIDAQAPQQKRLLNRVRFRVLAPIFVDGLWYYRKYSLILRSRYVKSRVHHGLFVPQCYEFVQTVEETIVSHFAEELESAILNKTPAPTHAEPDAEMDAFIAEIDTLLAEDDDTPIYEDRIPKAAPTR